MSVTITLKEVKQEYSVAEAYKTLRTNLQFCGKDKQVINITSCTPNEGKSSVSLQLAKSLSEIGKKVIFIDADMRKSVLAGEIEAAPEEVHGLAHFLSGQDTLEGVICHTNYENLDIITVGRFPPNPAELIDSENFMLMTKALREFYDYAIIDTPPLGSVIDSASIARYCDGAILVIEVGVISYKYAREVQEQLEKSNCPILGVVLNKVDLAKGRYGRYARYGRYGKYGRYYKYYTHGKKKQYKYATSKEGFEPLKKGKGTDQSDGEQKKVEEIVTEVTPAADTDESSKE